jgi:tripartite-type tricarboxylate transporter receptor subunit TctC
MRPAGYLCLGLAAAQPFAVSAQQPYPAKPVRLVVGFLAGGAVDLTARLLTPRLGDALGQSVVIENRPGAGGVIAAGVVAKAAPDGYTLLMIAQPDVVQPALRKRMPYDIVRDFAPISLITVGPYLLCVHPVMPAKNVKDLIALARARPGGLNYASAGVGSSAHLANELFNTMAHVRIVHVPFKGTPEGMAAIVAGMVDMNLASVASAQPLVGSGKVKALAVSSAQRFPLYPDIPTISESGLPGFERSGWYGIAAPAGTPREIVGRLSEETAKIIHAPEVKDLYLRQGLVPTANTPDQFSAFIRKEIVETAKLVKMAGVTAE